MGNTYTQIQIQVVFAVQFRQRLIHKSWRDELYKYITGIVQNNNHKMLQIGGMPDHLHLFIGMRPSQSLSDLMRQVKGESSEWINEKGFVKGRFAWQAGYGAFSYATAEIPRVIRYIQNQETHHTRKTFVEEYSEFLREFEIDYDDRYIFKPPV